MANHTRTEKIGGDSILMFVVIQVERKTVMTVVKPNIFIASDIKQRFPQDKSKTLALPLKPLWNWLFPYSFNQDLGEKLLVNTKDKSSSLRDGKIALSSSDSLESANANLDKGLYRHESNTCADLGTITII